MTERNRLREDVGAMRRQLRDFLDQSVVRARRLAEERQEARLAIDRLERLEDLLEQPELDV